MTRQPTHQHNPGVGCDSGCRFRALYQGAQLSLSDMTARQAEALGRVGRLRVGVVTALRHVFPSRLHDAERELGRRLNDVDDEVLLAYLRGLLEQQQHASTPSGVGALRCALEGGGFILPAADNLEMWAASISVQQRPVPPPPQPVNQPPLPTAQPVTTDASSAVLPNGGVTGASFDDVWADTPSSSTVTNPDRNMQTPTSISASVPVVVVSPPEPTTVNEPASPFDDGSPFDGDVDVSASPFDDDLVSGDVATVVSFLDDAMVPESGTSDEDLFTVADFDTFGDLFESTTPPVVPDGTTSDPVTASRQLVAGESFGDLFADVPTPVDLADVLPVQSPITVTAIHGTVRGELLDDIFTDAAGDVMSPVETLGDLFGDEPHPPTPAAPSTSSSAQVVAPLKQPSSGSDRQPAEDGAGVEPSSSRDAATITAFEVAKPQRNGDPVTPGGVSTPVQVPLPGASTQRATTPPLRPRTTAPTPGKTLRRRPVRGQQAAEATGEVDTVDVPASIDDALLAAVAVPRPVFLADLTAIAEPAVLEAWEYTQRGQVNAKVKFIPAKSRHRQLGSLVLPYASLRDAASAFVRSWWAECLERYRGAKLFELGVLLRMVGEAVVSHRLNNNTVMLRLNERRGLIGMIVVLENSLEEGSDARNELVACIEELLRERLQMIAVLGVSADIAEGLADVLTSESVRRRWKPTMPVAVSKSWDWADTRGSSARVVLNG